MGDVVDRRAQIEQWFEEHHAAVWAYVRRLAGPEAAEDLAGEVFCTAIDRIDDYDPHRAAPRAWLYGIATNLVRNHHRGRGRSSDVVARLAAERMQPGLGPATATALRIGHQATIAALRDAVATLPLSQREVVVLVLWEEHSYEAAAAVLEVPVGTVRSRLNRARESLRRQLAGHLGHDAGWSEQ